MNLLKTKIWIACLALTLVSCGGGFGGFFPRQNTGSVAAGGAVAGAAATKVVDKIKEVAEFTPYLVVETLEICYKSFESDGQFRCILTQCEEGNKEHCERYIPEELAMKAVEDRTAIVINMKGWARFISAVEVKIKEDPEGVRQKYEDYKHIDKILIIGE